MATEARHRINLIPQSWCVIGEVGAPERAERAMRAAHDLLDTPYGLSLLWPPYDGADPRVNGTATYPPGAKENGGIFCHAAAWSIIAAAMQGDGDRAYEYYRQLLPLARADVGLAAVEPYVYCQNICGPAHPQFGLGRNAWLTGAAAWTYVAATQWILGIRPTFQGLRVAPVPPRRLARLHGAAPFPRHLVRDHRAARGTGQPGGAQRGRERGRGRRGAPPPPRDRAGGRRGRALLVAGGARWKRRGRATRRRCARGPP